MIWNYCLEVKETIDAEIITQLSKLADGLFEHHKDLFEAGEMEGSS